MYLLLYISSLIVCLLPTFNQYKNSNNYRSLGASGAVSAIVFAVIFLEPTSTSGLILIPIEVPSFIFGFIYLTVTYYLA
ncbi:rhomboid family intramembrane serine protease, partial [Acinetobacter baumannii]